MTPRIQERHPNANFHSVGDVRRELRSVANPAKAEILRRFFKTGEGEYGEGDRFLGIQVPVLREIVRASDAVPLRDVQRLLDGSFHEERLVALLILVRRYERGTPAEKEETVRVYRKNFRRINSWDLVDLSAPNILGGELVRGRKLPIERWARSSDLWTRRIATLSTFALIRKGEFSVPLRVATLLLHDPHDLIHKAVGWMLREIGKRDLAAEERFLRRHYRSMPRTMLRYAIERFPESKRQRYLRATA